MKCSHSESIPDYCLILSNYNSAIIRLITSLDEFKDKESTYSDPEAFLEMILSSVAKEINKIDEDRKLKEQQRLNNMRNSEDYPKPRGGN